MLNGIEWFLAVIKGKGILLGALMGLLHELHLHYKGQKRIKFFPVVISMVLSGTVGYVTDSICEASNVSECLTLFYVAVTSLNAIFIITAVQSKDFIQTLINTYTKKVK